MVAPENSQRAHLTVDPSSDIFDRCVLPTGALQLGIVVDPYLMEALMHLELTFCGFEATRRMRQAMKVAKLPEPRFRQIEVRSHRVHVTLQNRVDARQPVIADDPVWNLT